ncbi:MAG: class II fructose-bisphosphate aldolase [Anaerolineales bacterium]|nr:class II fructose-bisphosphate aldolase [Anaerolineales bacterium]
MNNEALQKVFHVLDSSIEYSDNALTIKDSAAVRSHIGKLAELSALGSKAEQSWARYIARLIAVQSGAVPASIHELYIARGRGEVPPTFTVPAMNLRALSYEAARCVFRVAREIDAGAFIFEIARSEIGYTEQRPAEYATNILCAAVAEGYQGPVFIQGDHFQISAKRYKEDPADEIAAVEELTVEAMQAGFFNIDIDTSTLVDINQVGEPAQQRLNSELSAHFTHFIRRHEPDGVTVSVGGEIGEVGGRNSNEAELRAYVDGFQEKLDELGDGLAGLSKISIQTGTSHGGVVLPDGSVAKVKVDFDTLLNLSRVARNEYGFAGAVQHGASTLPQDAFGKFVEAGACEVHLATNFQNILYERIPKALLAEVYAYVDEKYAGDRKPDHNDEQFHYENRKRALGPFKAQMWALSDAEMQPIIETWEAQFRMLFGHLAIGGTRKYVDEFTTLPDVKPQRDFYFGEEAEQEEVKDLAD